MSIERSTFYRNLGIAGCVAVLGALLFHMFATPALVSWFVASGPVEEVAKFDRTRTEVTRQVASAFIAGLIGPAPASGDVGVRAGTGGGTGAEVSPRGSVTERDFGAKNAEEDEAGARETAPFAGDRDEQPSPESEGETPDRGEASGAEVPESPLRFEIDRRQLNRHLRNTRALRRQVTVASNRTRGGDFGLRVLELSGFYAGWGIRPGDIVLSVNGERLHTRQGAIAKVMQMRQSTQFRLQIRREGEVFEAVYHIPRIERDGK